MERDGISEGGVGRGGLRGVPGQVADRPAAAATPGSSGGAGQAGAALRPGGASLLTLALLVAAFALTLVSVWTARNAGSGQPDWLVNLTRLVKVATCLCVAAGFRSCLPDVHRVFAVCAAAGVLYAASYAADAVAGAGSFGSLPAGLALAVCGGVEDGLALMLVTHLLIAFPLRCSLAAIPVAYLANEALYLGAAYLPSEALVVARPAAALLAVGLLGACLGRARRFAGDAAMRSVQYGFPASGDSRRPLRILVDGRDWALVLAGATLFPLVFGAVSQATGASGLPGLYGLEYEVVALALLGGLVVYGVRAGERLTYPAVLAASTALFAGGCTLLPLLVQAGLPAWPGGVLVKCGYTLYQVTFWMLIVHRAHDDPRHAYLVFGVFYGVFELATLAARAAVHAFVSAVALSATLLAFDVCLVMLWLLAMYGLVFFALSRRGTATGEALEIALQPVGQEQPPAQPASAAPASLPVDTLGLALAAAERDFGLSARECEVVAELIHGYSMENIGRKLGITRDTVKTHARRIYRKLGVASKQELISMLERYPLGL